MPQLLHPRICNQLPKWLLVAVLILWMCKTNAAVLTVDRETRQINPLSTAEIYKDTSGELVFEDILRPETQRKFAAATPLSGDLNLGFTDATYWIKLTLASAPGAPNDWILEIPYLNLNSITFYAPGRAPIQVGTDFSSATKPIFYPLYALPLRLSTQPQAYYLKIKSQYAITVPMMLWNRAAFSREYSDNLLTQALYFGGVLSLALYNFLLYLSLKDRSYLLYTLFALTLCLGIFSGNGYGRLYLWPESAAWDAVSQATIYCVAGALSLWFTASFLRTREVAPYLTKTINALGTAYLVTSGMFVWSVVAAASPALLFQLFLIITLPASLCTLLAGILAYQANNRSALYFLFACSALWLGGIVASLRAFDLVPTNGLTLYALQIGSSLEMLLLSFTLAYRIHNERDQRIRAQGDVINARNDLLVLAQKNEAQLESKVAERSIKLQQIALTEMNIRQQYVRFGAMIAHEFRNPLSIIQTQSTLLQRENKLGINKVDDRTETIISASHRLTALFDQWLKSDQLQQPISQIHASPITLNQLIEPVLRAARTYHHDRLIESQHAPALTISGDLGLLEIALLNLIDNACKYSPVNEPVSINFKQRENQIGIIVADSGQGLPSDHYEEIFKPYVRKGDISAKPGTGLGLAFVAHITELHDGEIEVSSQLQKGSQFCLWIPCKND